MLKPNKIYNNRINRGRRDIDVVRDTYNFTGAPVETFKYQSRYIHYNT